MLIIVTGTNKQYRTNASDFAYSYPYLRNVVTGLSSVCRLSHSCSLLKPFDGFACHLAGTLAGSNDTLC